MQRQRNVNLSCASATLKREGEGGCAGVTVTVWMRRCDIDAQMCGGGEVHLQMSWDTLSFWDTVVGCSSGSLLWEALATHSRLHFAPSTRTISAEGCVSWRSGGAAPGLKRES